VSVRIGSFLFTANTLVLPFALAFFLVLGYQRLFPAPAQTRKHACGALIAAALCGIAGAWAYARAAAQPGPDLLHGGFDLHFGSFGGYWGALLGVAVYARATKAPPLAFADALVPGILAGAMVARIGCVFTGCCQGILFAPHLLANTQIFRPWPLYDIAALLLTLLLVRRGIRTGTPGISLAIFLFVYGLLRFLLEFLRDAAPVCCGCTSGQLMALIQAAAGLALLLCLLLRRAKRANE
jgi:prolipoprotein diacylglyceryltransferase